MALLEVKKAKDGGQRTTESIRKDLQFLAVLVKDVNLLYSTALGTYDFELVVMVAQVAQKDPKEYLPFLKELSQQPEALGKYNIDLHLKRYALALTHLSQVRRFSILT